jgi:hypothetical protein
LGEGGEVRTREEGEMKIITITTTTAEGGITIITGG